MIPQNWHARPIRSFHRPNRLSSQKRTNLRIEPLENRAVPASLGVTTTADLSSFPTETEVSLRGAIRYMNGLAEENYITLPAGTYSLAQTGTNEDAALTGDLDILPTGGTISIFGAGADKTIIDAAEIDRVFDVHPGARLLIYDATIRGGSADHGAGVRSRGRLAIHNSIVEDNTATLSGGAVHTDGSNAYFASQESTYRDNFVGTSADSTGFGGAIYNVGGTIQINDGLFEGNRTGTLGSGGAVYSQNGYFVAITSSFSQNRAGLGGAVATQGGFTNLVESTFTGNRAEFSGFTTAAVGGAVKGSGEVYIERSTFIQNHVIGWGRGGALANSNYMEVVNCTLSGNTAGATGQYGAGAGIYNSGGFKLINSTVVFNQTFGGGFGDGVLNNASPAGFYILNSIVAQNGSIPENNGPDTYGGFASDGGNLIGVKAGSDGWTTLDQVGSSFSPIDPRVGPLRNNGGPTETHSLLPGSPAIDAGNYGINLGNTGNVDQRGLPRTASVRPDVGSYELQDINNDPPVGNADAYAVDEDDVLQVAAPEGVLANDSDPESDPLEAILIGGPAHGELEFNDDGSFEYTPNPNHHGSDSFTYRAFDGSMSSDVTTVTLTVNPLNDAPIVDDDAYAIDEDDVLEISAADGVLSDDSDADGDSLTAELISGPEHGDLVFNDDGSFVYTPEENYNGMVSFSYQAFDGTAGSLTSATVTLTVQPVNDAPIATQNLGFFTWEEQPYSGEVTATDVDGDTLTFTVAQAPTWGNPNLNSDGTFTYSPFVNFHGGDGFTFRVSDGELSDTAVVHIVVGNVNDAPEAFPVNIYMDEDTSVSNRYLSHRDIDSTSLTFTVLPNNNPGEFSYEQSTGKFSYRPPADFNGLVEYEFKVSDGQLESNTSTLKFHVGAVNDAPVAQSGSKSTNEDTVLNGQVTANDVDGDVLSYEVVSQPAHGSLVLAGNGFYTYTPHLNYNGPDSFTFRASDGSSFSNSAAINLTISPVNDAPTANAGSDATIEIGATAAFDGQGSFDPDGDVLTYAWNFGDGGTGSGATPTHRYTSVGEYTVALTVSDGTLTSTDSLKVTVSNTPPVAGLNGPDIAVPGQTVGFTFFANDPSPGDNTAGFVYQIAWGDGQSESVSGAVTGVTRPHVYTTTGPRIVTVTAIDQHGGTSVPASGNISVSAANMQNGSLFIGGTTVNDLIDLRPFNNAGVLTARLNGNSLGDFTPTADIVIFGQSGNDTITISSVKIRNSTITVNRPTFIFGSDGNDTLSAAGATAGAVVIGGNGIDSITGGTGDDILVGGLGADTVRGGNGDDITIGGWTQFDQDLTALRALRSEWVRPDNSFNARVAHLRGQAGGNNGSYFLVAGTVIDDGVSDTLYGEGGTDWFFAIATGMADQLPDDKKNEEFTWL